MKIKPTNLFLLVLLFLLVTSPVYSLINLSYQSTSQNASNHSVKVIGKEESYFFTNENPFSRIEQNSIVELASKAFDIVKQSIDVLKQLEQQSETFVKAYEFYTHGSEYYKSGQYEKAIGKFVESNKLFERAQSDQYMVNSMNAIAKSYYHMRNYSMAIEYFEKTLEVLKKLHPTGDHTEAAKLISHLGLIHKLIGNYNQAVDYFLKAHEMRKRLFESGVSSEPYSVVVNPLVSVANVYFKINNYPKALEYFEQALSLLDLHARPGENQKEVEELLAYVLNNMGLCYRRLKQADKSLESFVRSFEIYNRLHNKFEHEDLAMGLQNMGDAYKILGYHQTAIDYLQRSLDMYEKVFKSDRSRREIVSVLVSLGVAYLEKSEIERALGYFLNAYELNQQIDHSKDDDEDVMERILLNNVASTYHKLGQYQNALDYYTKSLSLYQKANRQHEKIGSVLYCMASCHFYMGEYQKALDYFEKSYLIRRSLVSTNNNLNIQQEIVSSLKGIGDAHYHLDNHPKAIHYFQLAVDKLIKYDSKDSDLPKIYQAIVRSYNLMGDVKQEIEFIESTLKGARDAASPRVLDVSTIGSFHYRLGFLYEKLNETELALKNYGETLQLIQREAEFGHPESSNLLHKIGKQYEKMGELKRAHEYFKEAFEMYRKFKGTLDLNDPLLVSILDDLDESRTKLNEPSKRMKFDEPHIKDEL